MVPAWAWPVIVIHVLVSVGMILAILLHSGKGTGLSNAFGGGLPSTFAGTSLIERNLDRITIGLGVTFGITSFVLMLALKGTAK
jgi:preprotein translocase subunit SecG